jgi:hypothetical protein
MTKTRKPQGDKAPSTCAPATGPIALDELQVENLHRITPTLYRSAQPRRAEHGGAAVNWAFAPS